MEKLRVAHAKRGHGRILGLCLASTLLLVAGCRQDMQNQPKMVPQRGSSFFADQRSVRPQVEHTVARGQLGAEDYFSTGLINGKEADLSPFPVTMTMLARGQERFNIYCTPCHSRVGNGAGMIVMRGYKPAANFHDAKRMADPLSHYFFVMSNGFGAMPNYSAQLTPSDRWAVAAYIRALQLSQNAVQADVPAGVTVENLKDVAQQEGYPASFADPWALPESTSVDAEPTDASQGYPAMAPARSNTSAPWQNQPQPLPPGAKTTAPSGAK